MKPTFRRTLAILFVAGIATAAQQAPILAANASIGSPAAVTTDASGNVYFSSSVNQVFKVDRNGALTVAAGNSVAGYSGDGGPATSAELNNPQGVVCDGVGNLYIADSGNNRVRRVSPAGVITTMAGNGIQGYSGDNGPATGAELSSPSSLGIDGAGDLYILAVASVATIDAMVVRKVTQGDGTITTAAGGLGYSLLNASGIAVDQAGTFYVAVWMTNSIYKFSPSGAPLPGYNGVFGPAGVAVDPAGDLYAVDTGEIYAVSTTGLFTLMAGGGSCDCLGDGGPAVNARLDASGIAFDRAGNLYIADSENQRVRKVSLATGIITTIAGTGGPVISSVVSGASFQPGLVSNSWVTILGTNLSSTTDTWANAIVNGNLPTSLDGVSVNVSGQSAYICYVSPNQINAVFPNLPPGIAGVTNTISVIVSAPTGTSNLFSMPEPIYWLGYMSETLQPAFFQWPGGYAVATRQDYSWAVKNGTFPGTATVSAKPGDVVTLWGTGFGPTSPAAPVGVQIPVGTIYNTASPVTVSVGGSTAVVYGAALAPGYAGLYQVAIQIPPSLANGDYPVIAIINGVQSPTGVLITVQH